MLTGFIYLLSICFISFSIGGIVFFFVKSMKLSSCLEVLRKKIFGGYIKRKERKMIEKQLPDVVDMMRNSLKVGFGLQQMFIHVSEEAEMPIKREFETLVCQLRLGRTIDELLIDLKERIRIKDLALLVDSILVLKKTGGNLVAKFELIAEVLRSRQRIKAKIDLLVSQGKYQCLTVLMMPFALILVLSVVADWYVKPLFNTYLGWISIAIMVALQSLGAFWMKKIISIRV